MNKSAILVILLATAMMCLAILPSASLVSNDGSTGAAPCVVVVIGVLASFLAFLLLLSLKVFLWPPHLSHGGDRGANAVSSDGVEAARVAAGQMDKSAILLILLVTAMMRLAILPSASPVQNDGSAGAAPCAVVVIGVLASFLAFLLFSLKVFLWPPHLSHDVDRDGVSV